MQRFRLVVIPAVAMLLVQSLSACMTPEGLQEHEGDKAAAAVEQVPADTVDPSSDSAGNLKVTWTATGGSARQDPLGLLSDTPLEKVGAHLRAQRTVKFKPTAPEAKSAEGKYVYVMDLVQVAADPTTWIGTMKIDWTMTIVRAGSKSEFHAVYKGHASATYSGNGKVTGGTASGTAQTSDTFSNGATKMKPRISSAPFEWTFDSQ
jgi:hypothetical protein